MPSQREVPADRLAALARYNAANGHTDDPKVTKLPKPKKTTADYNRTRNLKNQAAADERATQKAIQKADLKRLQQVERSTGRINSVLTRYNQPALEEVTPPPYDVSKVDRSMSKPPVFAPVKALVRNVQHKRSADERGAVGITPEDFKAWRESHLQMTGEQLGALIRVTARTVKMWETGQSRIPFAMYWVMKHLQPSDLPAGFDASKPTRYAPVQMVDNGGLMLERILTRYAYMMKEQGVTAAEFKNWRTLSMMMTPPQLAQLVRVPVKMVMAWESGKATIPFSMWWVMHAMLQDPETFVTRPGFHNFYIDYYDGEPMICSRTHPDIRYTITDLYVGRVAMRSVESMKSEMDRQAKVNDDLVAENIRLRQMLKAGTVATELATMHAHIGTLLKKMHTADVLAFPDVEATSDIIPFPRQATA